jgi:hypothetical protein
VIEDGETKRIPCDEYDKDIHTTPSSGYVSVKNKHDNTCCRIKVDSFDDKIHKKVLGGIVAIKEGKKQYVTNEEFKTGEYIHCHKGMVTVLDTLTNIRKHVSKEEFELNRDRYKHNTEGFVTGRDKDGNKIRISTSDDIKSELVFSTSGQLTVFDIQLNSFMNIKKEYFDKDIHKLAQDKMFICLAHNGEKLFKFWGSKKDFIKLYNLPYSFWKSMIDGKSFETKKQKFMQYNNCNFKIIKWKEVENVYKMWEEL